jgi:hypothetical protein
MDRDEHVPRQGERRLPMAIAVLVAGGLNLLVPEEFRFGEVGRVGYSLLLVAFLVVLVVGDPGRIDGAADGSASRLASWWRAR